MTPGNVLMYVKISIYSIAAQIVASVVVVFTVGAGHGSYAAARLLFPFTMLSTILDEGITNPLIVLGLIQYLLYGLIWAMAAKYRKGGLAIGLLAVLHVTAVMLVFTFPNQSFPN